MKRLICSLMTCLGVLSGLVAPALAASPGDACHGAGGNPDRRFLLYQIASLTDYLRGEAYSQRKIDDALAAAITADDRGNDDVWTCIEVYKNATSRHKTPIVKDNRFDLVAPGPDLCTNGPTLVVSGAEILDTLANGPALIHAAGTDFNGSYCATTQTYPNDPGDPIGPNETVTVMVDKLGQTNYAIVKYDDGATCRWFVSDLDLPGSGFSNAASCSGPLPLTGWRNLITNSASPLQVTALP